ncbi:hypothetical protein FRB93_006300 [Tulasnella sp. JGI-2019a]|nr:hypothetical protein FRB93_006300 [Tulasnella sp. JGI-2019a]
MINDISFGASASSNNSSEASDHSSSGSGSRGSEAESVSTMKDLQESPEAAAYRLALVKRVNEAFADSNANLLSSAMEGTSHAVSAMVEGAASFVSTLDSAAVVHVKKYLNATTHFCYAEFAVVVTFCRVLGYMSQISGSFGDQKRIHKPATETPVGDA